MLITFQSLTNCSAWTATSWLLCSSPYTDFMIHDLGEQLSLTASQHVSRPLSQANDVSATLYMSLRNMVYLLLSTIFILDQGLDSQGCHQSIPRPPEEHLASPSPTLSNILTSVIKPIGNFTLHAHRND